VRVRSNRPPVSNEQRSVWIRLTPSHFCDDYRTISTGLPASQAGASWLGYEKSHVDGVAAIHPRGTVRPQQTHTTTIQWHFGKVVLEV
jgi:hypothetical protein